MQRESTEAEVMEDDRKRTSNKLRKSLQLYLSKKLRKIPPIHIPSSAAIPTSITSARLLNACRFPRTPSLDLEGDHHTAAAAPANDDSNKNQAATLSDVDRFLFDNFRSLYIHDDDDGNDDPRFSSSLLKGTSTSLVDETRPTSTAAAASSSSESTAAEDVKEAARPGEEESGDSTAVVVFSMDPYTDFRRSMQNMIRMHHGSTSQPMLDWDFLEELLFYYLQLNDRAVHKHILKAFADLTAGTRNGRPSTGEAPAWTGKSVRSRKY